MPSCVCCVPRVSGPAAGAHMEVETEKCAEQLLTEGTLSDMGCHCWVIATIWFFLLRRPGSDGWFLSLPRLHVHLAPPVYVHAYAHYPIRPSGSEPPRLRQGTIG